MQVATGIIGANVIRTDSLAVNSYTIEIQQSTTSVAKDTTKNGVAHFDSDNFTVDEGFVSISTPKGTYTPTLSFAGDSTGITYSTPQVGEYLQVGSIVFINLSLVLSNKGSGVGQARITLPPGLVNIVGSRVTVALGDLTLPGANTYVVGAVQGGLSYMTIEAYNGTFVSLANTDFQNTTSIYVTGFYYLN